ncbi:MAG: DUF2783 domain-containing protein [Paracoccaceae bacterium]
MKLIQTPNLPDHDSFYEALLAKQRGLSERDVLVFNSQLIMILANHIGDNEVLSEAMDLAAAP